MGRTNFKYMEIYNKGLRDGRKLEQLVNPTPPPFIASSNAGASTAMAASWPPDHTEPSRGSDANRDLKREGGQ